MNTAPTQKSAGTNSTKEDSSQIPTAINSPETNFGFNFELDRFQLEAIAALERGESVLVSAPTGAGKTVIAQHLISRTLSRGRRVFYTSPIKALANQKFRDLAQHFGKDEVGLLTGDLSIKSDSKVVVMTTEVLRNMLYHRRPYQSDDLGAVVLDEVHYLQDPHRGPVWEEVLMLLARSVQTASLSATVSNVEEFATWLRAIRGPTTLVTETKRPVPLEFEVAANDITSGETFRIPLLKKRRISHQAKELERLAKNKSSGSSHKGKRKKPLRRNERKPKARFRSPKRATLLPKLIDDNQSPLIWFIFSRAGCDEAVSQCRNNSIVLTDDDTAHKLGEIADEATKALSDDDWYDLGLDQWRTSFVDGVAAHHAGLIPAVKEAVETAFEAGLLPVVFATETLAVGINMPARVVVVDSLIKFNGTSHELLTPLQFTQLTGRAGRRALDTTGTAVLCYSPELTPTEMANLATSRDFRLDSAFAPNYNMVANLIQNSNLEAARETVSRSFAQFQADRWYERNETKRLESTGYSSTYAKRKKNALVKDFDALVELCQNFGFMSGTQISDLGNILCQINSESEAALAIAIYTNIFDGLEPAELAATVSALIYEPRRSLEPRTFKWPSKDTRDACIALREIITELRDGEYSKLRRLITKEADPTMCWTIYSWANGSYLDDLIEASVGAGDFVRLIRQVIDICRQISSASTGPLSEIAKEAAEILDHGVVRSARSISNIVQ